MRRSVVLCGLTLALVTAGWPAGELSNRRAPGFSLPDSNLKQHDLYDYRGKVVLVNIMKTDCPHCSGFSEVLGALQKEYRGRLQVLSIVNSPPENQGTVRDYQTKNNLQDSVILFDCRQVAISYFKLTPQRPSFEVPHVFLIDQKGWIQEDFGHNLLNRGIFEGEDLFPIVEKYLSKAMAEAEGASSAAEVGSE